MPYIVCSGSSPWVCRSGATCPERPSELPSTTQPAFPAPTPSAAASSRTKLQVRGAAGTQWRGTGIGQCWYIHSSSLSPYSWGRGPNWVPGDQGSTCRNGLNWSAPHLAPSLMNCVTVSKLLTSVRLSFLVCNMGIIICLSHLAVMRI